MRDLGTQNLSALSSIFWFNWSYQTNQMPYQMESLKLAERSHAQRRMAAAIMLATAVGILASFWPCSTSSTRQEA